MQTETRASHHHGTRVTPQPGFRSRVAGLVVGGVLSGCAALAYVALSAAGIEPSRAISLLLIAPLVEEHLKLGALALAKRSRHTHRLGGAWIGAGFGGAEMMLVSMALLRAGHGEALLAVVALRLVLTMPLHVWTARQHERALNASRDLGGPYRRGSGLAVLVHAAYNGGLLIAQGFWTHP